MLSNLFHFGQAPLSGPPDWDALIPYASSESVLPALAERARVLGLASTLAGEIRELLDTAASLNAERNQLILGEAIHTSSILGEIGIKPVALKGLAYLLTGVYGNPASRYLLDIDLLISHEVLKSSVEHLWAHGYLENDYDGLVEFRHHQPALRRSGCAQVELHHKLGIGICDRLLPAAEILAQATPLTVSGSTFLVPSPTHLASHLVLHSQLAHSYRDRIFPPLRALIDLQYLHARYGAEINWEGLAETYRAHGQYGTFALHLMQANHILGFPVLPEKIGPLIRLRFYRRLLLNRYPGLRFVDPTYLFMSAFSRRLRLVPQILRHPESWGRVVRVLTQGEFYRNLFSV